MGTAIGPGGMGVLLELTGNDFELGLTVAGLLLIAPVSEHSINANFFPRQARDKHRESSQKRLPFSQVAMFITAAWLDRRVDLIDHRHHHDHPQGGKAPGGSGSHGYTALGTNEAEAEAEEGAAAAPAVPSP